MLTPLQVLALLGAVAAALGAVLNFLPAPPSRVLWKVALLFNEGGHWLALVTLGLGLGVLLGPGGGWWRPVVLALCAGATPALLRPAVGAWRRGRAPGDGAFAVRRLFWPTRPPRAPVTCERVVAADGTVLPLDCYAPAQRPPAGAPCLVVIHGGGWDSGDRTQLAGWNHRWAARGWVVAAVSYRLAPGAIWPAQRDDVQAALAHLKAHAGRLGVDAQRLVLLGRSAGGQLATAVGLGAGDPAIRGVVALYAPHDMRFAWSVSREDDALNSVRLMRQYFGGAPDTPERVALYESASGQGWAHAGAPPVLLLHGRLDTLAWHRHSVRLAARLREVGGRVEHHELPWATHGFDFNPDGPGGQLADAWVADFVARVTR